MLAHSEAWEDGVRSPLKSLILPRFPSTESEVLTWVSEFRCVLGLWLLLSVSKRDAKWQSYCPPLVQVGSPRRLSLTHQDSCVLPGHRSASSDPTLPRPEGPCGLSHPASHGRSRGPVQRPSTPGSRGPDQVKYSDDPRKISRQDKNIPKVVLSPN